MRSRSGVLVDTANRNCYVSKPNVSELLELVGKGLLLFGQAVRRVLPVLVNLNEALGLRTWSPISAISAVVSLVRAIAFAALGRGLLTAILLMSQLVAAGAQRYRAVSSSVALALALSTLSLGARLCKVTRFTAQTAGLVGIERLHSLRAVIDHMVTLTAPMASDVSAFDRLARLLSLRPYAQPRRTGDKSSWSNLWYCGRPLGKCGTGSDWWCWCTQK